MVRFFPYLRKNEWVDPRPIIPPWCPNFPFQMYDTGMNCIFYRGRKNCGGGGCQLAGAVVRSSSSSGGEGGGKLCSHRWLLVRNRPPPREAAAQPNRPKEGQLLLTLPDNGQKDADSELCQRASGCGALLWDGVPWQRPRHNLLLLQVHWIVQ